MREEAFRTYLGRFLTPLAVSSYLSNGRRVERVTGITLDEVESDPALFGRIADALRADGASPGAVSSCLTATRRYLAFVGHGEPMDEMGLLAAEPAETHAPSDEETGFKDSSVADLMKTYARILVELRRRGLTRSGNGPVGDFAEALFARAFGWKLEGNSAKGIDATTAEGRKVQIKARRMTSVGGARHLGAIRSIDAGSFDILAVAFFDADMMVSEAYLLPHSMVAERVRYVRHTNSWRLVLPRSIGVVEEVEDVTATMRAAAAEC